MSDTNESEGDANILIFMDYCDIMTCRHDIEKDENLYNMGIKAYPTRELFCAARSLICNIFSRTYFKESCLINLHGKFDSNIMYDFLEGPRRNYTKPDSAYFDNFVLALQTYKNSKLYGSSIFRRLILNIYDCVSQEKQSDSTVTDLQTISNKKRISYDFDNDISNYKRKVIIKMLKFYDNISEEELIAINNQSS